MVSYLLVVFKKMSGALLHSYAFFMHIFFMELIDQEPLLTFGIYTMKIMILFSFFQCTMQSDYCK